MREIKFRGYNGVKWLYGTEISILSDVQIFMPNHEHSPTLDNDYIPNWDEVCYVGQYTGLKDKNGVEIYEGDIIEYKSKFTRFIGKIVYGLYNDISQIDLGYYIQWFENDCIRIDLGYWKHKGIEVIGNIWEDGDLLNDSENTEKY